MSLTQQLSDEVINTRLFQYVPARSNPRSIELKAGNTIGLGAGITANSPAEFDRWGLAFDEKKRQYSLKLYLNDDVRCTFKLMPEGEWRGRDRDNGHVILRAMPMGTQERWRQHGKGDIQPIINSPQKPVFKYLEALPPQINWGEYDYNLAEFISVEKMPSQDTAVAIIGWNRPDYFKEVVQSIAQNPEVAECKFPVFVFLDRSEQEETLELQAAFAKDVLKTCTVIKRPRNYGCGRNLIDVRRQLFDNLGFKQVFMFEDDMIVSPKYISLCLNLLEWGKENYDNVGAVQAWQFCTQSPEVKLLRQQAVVSTFANWWGYLLRREAWDMMKADVYEYEQLFLGSEYRLRPHRSILSWMRAKMKTPPKATTKQFPVHDAYEVDRDHYFRAPPTGQDAVTMMTFMQAGWMRLATTVNRCEYIGRSGIHMNPGWFERTGFQNVKMDEMPGDEIRTEFTPIHLCPSLVETASPIAGFNYIDRR